MPNPNISIATYSLVKLLPCRQITQRFIFGIAKNTGNLLWIFHDLLIRNPINKTTNFPATSAVIFCLIIPHIFVSVLLTYNASDNVRVE
jgi:uncharacterized protein with PQ loop repeat